MIKIGSLTDFLGALISISWNKKRGVQLILKLLMGHTNIQAYKHTPNAHTPKYIICNLFRHIKNESICNEIYAKLN